MTDSIYSPRVIARARRMGITPLQALRAERAAKEIMARNPARSLVPFFAHNPNLITITTTPKG